MSAKQMIQPFLRSSHRGHVGLPHEIRTNEEKCIRIPDTFRYSDIMGCPLIFIHRLALRLFVLKSYNY